MMKRVVRYHTGRLAKPLAVGEYLSKRTRNNKSGLRSPVFASAMIFRHNMCRVHEALRTTLLLSLCQRPR